MLSDPAKRKEQASLFLEWCVQEDGEKMVAEAVRKGMEDPEQVAPNAGSPGAKATPTPVQPQSMKPRALMRMDTEEEHDRLRKNGVNANEGRFGNAATEW